MDLDVRLLGQMGPPEAQRYTHTHPFMCSAQNHLEPISSAVFPLKAGVWCVSGPVVFLLSLLGFDRVSLESAARFFGLP